MSTPAATTARSGDTPVEEVALFLARCPPFRELAPHQVEALAARVRIETYPAPTIVLRQSGEPARGLFVIRSGTVDLSDEGQLVDRLEEGELFGLSVLSGLGPTLTATVHAHAECYMLDADGARALLGTAAGLKFLALSMARWRERDAAERHVRRAGVDDALVVAIGRATDVASLIETSCRLPMVVRSLLDAGVDPIDIGHVVGVALDHITTRLLELHIQEAGDPPAAFAWVSLGSAARHEQALSTDQDHAIALGCREDEIPSIDPYFADLATTVTNGLEACGIARCQGNVMAENPAWRRTIDGWRDRFAQYVSDPQMIATRVSSIAFDYRRLTGTVDIEPILDEVIRSARHDPGFIGRLARAVLELEPPTGRFRDLVLERRGEHAGTIDIKHGGLTIITNLARFSAIRAGLTENGTVERLRGAAAAGVIPVELRDALIEASRLLWRIRIEHHVEQIERGELPDDFVAPGRLTPITRRALGAALQTIAMAQKTICNELRL